MRTYSARKSPSRRRGYSLLELTLSLAAAVVLMAGMASAVAVSARSLKIADDNNGARAIAADVQRDFLADIQRATGFTERTANAVTFTVPDRTGDGQPETLRYAWSGTPGDPLTLQMNGGPTQNIALNVQNFALGYRIQSLTAPVVPDQAGTSSGRLLFVSGPPGMAPTFTQTLNGPLGTPITETSRDPKIVLFQSWGFEVTTIAADQSQADFAEALTKNDVVFLSSDAGVTQAATWLANIPLGIVNENTEMAEPLGFYQGAGTTSGTTATIGLINHYITQGYSARQNIPVVTTASSLQSFLNPKASGLSILGVNVSGNTVNFATLAAGRNRFDGSTATGRRVQLPWAVTNFSPSSLTADGKALLKASLLWAVGNGSDGNPSLTTFGLTDSELRSDYFTSSGTLKHASKFSLSARGELLELSAYVRSNNLPIRLAIYSDSNGEPGACLGQTAALNGMATDGWITGSITPVVLEPGTYWLAVALSNSTQQAYCDNPLAGVSSQISQSPFASGFPATWEPGAGGATTTILLKQLLMYGSFLALP